MWYAFIVAFPQSDSITELVKNVQMMKVIAKSDQVMMANLEKKQAQIEELKVQKQTEEDNAREQLEDNLLELGELSVSR